MHLIALLLHLLIDFLIGIGVLSFFPFERNKLELVASSVLVGFFVETMLGFLVLWFGGGIYLVTNVAIILALVVNIKNILAFIKAPKEKLTQLLSSLKTLFTYKWYDYILLVLIAEKIGFTLWQLNKLPTYFSDSLKTWSAQGRSIYGGNNFSMTPNVPEFLTRKLQLVQDYPLQLPIWRAVEATLNGGWNEFVSRADGLVMMLIAAGIVGGVFWRLFQRRWIALGAVLVLLSLPLEVWHAASGYGDIAVQAYVVAAVAAFIRKEWWLSGLFMAGAIWSKNDGLAIYLPGMLAAVFLYHIFDTEKKLFKRFIPMIQFGLGVALAFPWLVFQAIYTNSVFSIVLKPIQGLLSSNLNSYSNSDYQVVLVQNAGQVVDKPSSIYLIWEYVFLGSTHNMFWWLMLIACLVGSIKLLKDRIGRSLLAFFLITCFLIYYVFTFTHAYEYLLIQTTFHRTLLQFSAAALLVAGYASSLFYQPERAMSTIATLSPIVKPETIVVESQVPAAPSLVNTKKRKTKRKKK